MIKLYYRSRTRASRPRWALEELGLPYELVTVDRTWANAPGSAYLKIHPHGAVPALTDGELVMHESAAICLYLADRYPDRKLAPSVDSKDRGSYYQWILYTMTTVEPELMKIFMNTVMLPEGERSAVGAEEGKRNFRATASVLTEALTDKEFLLGAQFTMADIVVGSMLGWANFMGLTGDYPVLKKYYDRLALRPAYQRSQAE